MLKEVQECLRVDVNRYVRVNFESFADIIDAVDFEANATILREFLYEE